jgi:hypothetical protein
MAMVSLQFTRTQSPTEAGRNIPEKLRSAIERRLEKIAESEMDLDYGWIPHNASFGFLDMPRPALGQIHFLDRF